LVTGRIGLFPSPVRSCFVTVRLLLADCAKITPIGEGAPKAPCGMNSGVFCTLIPFPFQTHRGPSDRNFAKSASFLVSSADFVKTAPPHQFMEKSLVAHESWLVLISLYSKMDFTLLLFTPKACAPHRKSLLAARTSFCGCCIGLHFARECHRHECENRSRVGG